MPEPTTQEILSQCNRFLDGHGPSSMKQRIQEIADSPLISLRNDHYGRGGVATELEYEVASLFGKEAAAFMPSGTMAQQIALRIWADRSGIPRVAFHPTCHLQIHEQMAYSVLHHLEGRLLGDADRLFTLDDLLALEEPISTLLIELPQREIGGQLPSWDELVAICDTARSKGAKLHLDGARFWECKPFYKRGYDEIAALFDSVYVSFYKILGGLPGAILAGSADFIEESRVWLRRHGGNLQQQSPSAISASLGMERHLPRIADYVAKAAEIAAVLRGFDQISVVPEEPPTNMMHVTLQGDRERLQKAALQIAMEDKVGLFFRLSPEGRFELSVGAGALSFELEEIRRLFEKLFAIACD